MTVDDAKAAVFLAAFFINRQAGWVLLAHFAAEYIYASPLRAFDTALTQAALYALVAAHIRLKSEIRQVFICLSCVSWLCAVDIFIAPKSATMFSVSYSHIVNFLDAMIIYHLFSKGGPQVVRKDSGSGFNSVVDLYLRKKSKANLRAGQNR